MVSRIILQCSVHITSTRLYAAPMCSLEIRLVINASVDGNHFTYPNLVEGVIYAGILIILPEILKDTSFSGTIQGGEMTKIIIFRQWARD